MQGAWCFYEQEAAGSKMPEQVTITLLDDGRYQWSESLWKQEGVWVLEQDRLLMTGVGSHRLIALNHDRLEMGRGSIMRWHRGACGHDGHAAASLSGQPDS